MSQLFWSKVDCVPGCCWEYIPCPKDVYGKFQLRKKPVSAHRVAYESAFGPIPKDQVVRHTCDNMRCCNPEHLVLGSQADNMADKVARQRQAKGIDHGNSKLSDEQVLEIFNSSDTGIALAKRFGIARSTVSAIKQRHNWSWLTQPF